MISSNEIRKKWIEFFKDNGHYFLEPVSLIPNNDPSLLWINSGVATIKDYFTGKLNPPSQKLVNVQKCIRTNDIFNVGYTSRHHTLFEMLGFFSIGDYFKNEAIEFGFKLLKHFNFPLEKIYITVYMEDEFTYNKWIELGVNPNKIIKCDKDRNFWDVGQGPCGPCTELHYDRGEKYDPDHIGEKLIFEDIENDRYIEIGNIVFSQYNNDGKNNYTELARKNIDTGWGFERWACILQDVPTNFDTDIFLPIINEIEKMTNLKYDMNAYFTKDPIQVETNHSFRVIADHLRAVIFAIADGASPSNNGRGSIIRKLIRRIMVCSRKIGIKNIFKSELIDTVIKTVEDFYSYLNNEKEKVLSILIKEENNFAITLEKGYKLFENIISKNAVLDAETAFKLVDTYGFPFDIIKDLAEQKNIKIDETGFEAKFKKHQEISRANLEIKGMASQAPGLINFTKEANFEYYKDNIKDAQIIGIFDENFDPISTSNTKCWIVTNNTVLFATSGGQIHDDGYVLFKNDKFEVLDVIKGPNGQHFTLIDTDGIKISLNDFVDIYHHVENRRKTTRNHSSEHLLEHVMKENIDKSIKQMGAFKSPDRMTFDFHLPTKLTDEQIALIEDKINAIIQDGADVETVFTTLEDAKKIGAVANFENVYTKLKGDLRMVCFKGVVNEICGGTHVKNLNEIEKFMIVNCVSKGSGVWRLECISGEETIKNYLSEQIKILNNEIKDINVKINALNIENSELNALIKSLDFSPTPNNFRILKNKLVTIKEKSAKLIYETEKNNEALDVANIKTINRNTSNSSNVQYQIFIRKNIKNLTTAFTELSNENKNNCFVAINLLYDKIQYVVTSQNIEFKASEIIKKINDICYGKGGGNNNFAQGGSSEFNKLDAVVEFLLNI